MIAAPPHVKVTTGVPIGSFAVNVSVTSSPGFARVVVVLLDSMLTLDNVGAVSSNVTEVPSVTAVTAVPAFPAESLNAILKATAPSVSLALAV